MQIRKTVYISCKGILFGSTPGTICWKNCKQCIKDITAEDISYLAGKMVTVYCAPTVDSIVLVGAFANPQTLIKI